ncbi:767_t:CDS:1, partial [Rhizophagus irregularis]
LRSRLPPIVDEDKVIETNDNNQVTFFSDKLIMDFHRAHFAPITPTLQQQYPSTPEPDHLRLIKDGDERPIRKARK